MARDISYCNHTDCENRECMRHQCHLKPGDIVSVTSFPNCDYYKRLLAKQDEEDALREAKREMYKLDDNENTLDYKGRLG